MLKVGVVGATGYTGIELVRLLLDHSEVEITVLTSERQAGVPYSKAFPQFQGRIDVSLESFSAEKLKSKADFAFLCLPHHEAMDAAQSLLAHSVPVIDLSADFRLKDLNTYETWYGPHSQPKLLQQAVYGLPELFRKEIREAKLVANPGCYPTSCILGLAPLIQNKLIDLATIHCDSKSGVSGAGRTVSTGNMFCETNESLKAYKVGEHRHTPEIEQGLSQLAGQSVQITFVPHLIPMNRGILSTLYAKNSSKLNSAQLHEVYNEFYQKEPFVRIRDSGSFPSTQEVHMTNFCDIGVTVDPRTGRSIVVSAIDNLTKGASGQAVQNMNLMMGFPETTGLF